MPTADGSSTAYSLGQLAGLLLSAVRARDIDQQRRTPDTQQHGAAARRSAADAASAMLTAKLTRMKTYLLLQKILLRRLRSGGSVAELLACWTQAQKLSGNSLRQTVHTHRASVHQAAKLVSAVLTVARVTAGLAESNGSLPPGL